MSDEKEKTYVVDEPIGDSLCYKESVSEEPKGPARTCELWKEGVEKPVSSLVFFSFSQRFGSVAVPVEGIGNVNTQPEHRRKGYIKTLMARALAGAAARVDSSFLFGIGGLYNKFGFATCISDSRLSLWLKRIENLQVPAGYNYEGLTDNDIPVINELYNNEHAIRPCTRVRTPFVAKRLLHDQPWRPSPEFVVLKNGGTTRGYAFINGHGYGWGRSEYIVSEAVADSHESASVLLLEIRDRAMARGIDTVIINEPLDTTMGRTVRLLGGEYSGRFGLDSDGMGAVLNRPSLVQALTPELARRAGEAKSPDEAVAALASGDLIGDDKVLMRLLTGYWTWEDAVHAGEEEPPQFADTVQAWFCDGGSQKLPQPYAHGVDGY